MNAHLPKLDLTKSINKSKVQYKNGKHKTPESEKGCSISHFQLARDDYVVPHVVYHIFSGGFKIFIEVRRKIEEMFSSSYSPLYSI